MHPEVKIASSQEELCKIYLLRYAVYIDEMKFQYPHADHHKRMLYDNFDASAIHFFVEDEKGENAIGIYRLNILKPQDIDLVLESRYQLSSFLELGLPIGYSSKLMTHNSQRNLCTLNALLRSVFNYGIPRKYFLNILDCSPSLVPFYERLGFRKYTSNFMDPILGEKTPMVLFVEDLDHLQKVKSPLYNVCKKMDVANKDYSEWLSYVFDLMEIENA